jgi:hypothetical protein
MAISREEFETWEFRWPATTTVQLPDGRSVVIEPTGYLKSRESSVDTERGRKFLREYVVRFPNGSAPVTCNEIQLDELIGGVAQTSH